MVSPLAAANAYSTIARTTPDAAARLGKALSGGSSQADNSSFGSVLKDALASVNDIGKKSDAQSKALAAGKANIVDVATAVAETEVAIDAVVAVRDRVIQAYEEIMKMPI